MKIPLQRKIFDWSSSIQKKAKEYQERFNKNIFIEIDLYHIEIACKKCQKNLIYFFLLLTIYLRIQLRAKTLETFKFLKCIQKFKMSLYKEIQFLSQ